METIRAEAARKETDLASDARLALTALLIKARTEKTAAVTLANIATQAAEMAGSALSMYQGGETLAGHFKALQDAIKGKPAHLKEGYAKDFSQTWLTIAAYELAGGMLKNVGKPEPTPDVAPWVKKTVQVLTDTFGPKWEEAKEIETVFKKFRSDWKTMLTWEKKQLVRSTLKSAARTLKAQAKS